MPRRCRRWTKGSPAALLALAALPALLGAQRPDSMAAPSGVAAATATLTGTVLEAGGDRPVSAAWILLPVVGRRAQADEAGRFSVEGLPAGATLVLRVEALGYHPADIPLFLEEGGSSVAVRLEPHPVELEGMEVSAPRVYSARERLESRMDRFRFGSTVRGQLDLLTSDAPSMVDYLWEEARALLVPCAGDLRSWEWGCMRVRGKRIAVEVCVDDVAAPGGADMLHMYQPQDLFRVEVLPDNAQVRLYTRPYIAHISRTGHVPPIWPRWLGGCMGDDVAWAPPSIDDRGGGW